MSSYIISDREVGIFVNGSFRFVPKDSDQGQRLIAAIKKFGAGSVEAASIADIPAYIARWSSGRVEVDDRDQLRLDGKVVDFGISDVMKRMMKEGHNVEYLARFLENVASNPDVSMAPSIYGFLNKGVMPITPDGHFLAFKRVDQDYRSFTSGAEEVTIGVPDNKTPMITLVGRVPHNIGTVVFMKREDCDPDRTRTCSVGLHACSHLYLREYHNGRGKIVVVKINPRDVTAVPTDYDETKLRCCQLEVVGEVQEGQTAGHFVRSVDKRYVPQGWQDNVIEPEIETAPHDPFIRDGVTAYLSGIEDGCEDAHDNDDFNCWSSNGDAFHFIADEVKMFYVIGYARGYTENFALDGFHSEKALAMGKQDAMALYGVKTRAQQQVTAHYFDPTQGPRYHAIPADHDGVYAFGYLHELARLLQLANNLPNP